MCECSHKFSISEYEFASSSNNISISASYFLFFTQISYFHKFMYLFSSHRRQKKSFCVSQNETTKFCLWAKNHFIKFHRHTSHCLYLSSCVYIIVLYLLKSTTHTCVWVQVANYVNLINLIKCLEYIEVLSFTSSILIFLQEAKHILGEYWVEARFNDKMTFSCFH